MPAIPDSAMIIHALALVSKSQERVLNLGTVAKVH
jgi:hypothetical protein